MKEIKNWEVVIENEKGDEQIAILLPGCIIKGQIESKDVRIKTKDVNISDLTVWDLDERPYLLSGAKREYLNNIVTCITFGKNEIHERDGEER